MRVPVLPTDLAAAPTISGRIYEAAVGACSWKQAVEAVTRHFGSRAGNLRVTTHAGPAQKVERRDISFGLTAAQTAALRELDFPWAPRNGELPLGTLLSSEEVAPALSSACARFFAVPPLSKLVNAATIVASQRHDPERIWLTLFGFEGGAERLRVSLESTAWHFRHALHLECQVRCEQTEREALLDEIDQRRVGWMVLDRSLRARRASRVARALTQEDGVCLRPDGSFWTSEPRLLRRVREAFDARDGAEAGASFVARPAARPLMVTTRAVGVTAGLLCSPQVAVIVRLPDLQLTCRDPFLRAAYGLTAAEARFARSLLEGLTLKEAAARAGVSMNTARTHLKHAFAKTQTRRQTELVALLAASLAVTR